MEFRKGYKFFYSKYATHLCCRALLFTPHPPPTHPPSPLFLGYIIVYSLVEMQPQRFMMRNKQVKNVYCLLFVCVPQSHIPESSRSHQQQQLHSHTQGVRESVLKLCVQISPCMSHPISSHENMKGKSELEECLKCSVIG